MDDTSLEHYGIKGMRWGRRDNDEVSAGPVGKSSPKASPARTSKGSKPTAAVKSAPASPSPTRSFGPINRSAPSPTRAVKEGGIATRLPSRDKSNLTDAEKAHRKKMIIGGAAVVGILGVAAVGVTAYKVSPHAIASFDKLAVGSRSKVVDLLANPKINELKLNGNRKVNKAKLNVLFKQAEFAERSSKSGAGIFAKQKVAEFKANPAIARAGIGQNLNELRRDTEQMKAMNDAESYINRLIKNKSAPPLRTPGRSTPWNVGQKASAKANVNREETAKAFGAFKRAAKSVPPPSQKRTPLFGPGAPKFNPRPAKLSPLAAREARLRAQSIAKDNAALAARRKARPSIFL